jgi:hypothetical protein
MFSVTTMNPGPGVRNLNPELREIELARQDLELVPEKPRHKARTQILTALAFIGAGLGTTEFTHFFRI